MSKKPAEYTLEQAAGIFLDALSNTPYNNKPITDAQVITKELLKFLSDAHSYNPNAINEQKPAWSEEDDAYKLFAISAVEDYYDKENPLRKDLVDWLKYLKPQNTWKPSDEQMEVLKDLIEDNNQRHFYPILKSLYDDLEELKEK